MGCRIGCCYQFLLSFLSVDRAQATLGRLRQRGTRHLSGHYSDRSNYLDIVVALEGVVKHGCSKSLHFQDLMSEVLFPLLSFQSKLLKGKLEVFFQVKLVLIDWLILRE